MDLLTKVQTYLTVAEMLSVIMIALALTAKIWNDVRFRFILLLCSIVIMTDLSTILLIVGIGLETTDFHTKQS